VVTADERDTVRQFVDRSVLEHGTGPDRLAALLQQTQVGGEPDAAEGHDDPHTRERRDFRVEVGQAGLEFFRRRSVVGGRAAHRHRDERV